jgi:hypothetical protein
MERKVGLWIDYRKAVIVSIANKKVYIREIISNIKKKSIRITSDTVDLPDEKPEFLQNPQSKILLDKYYNLIISLISDAESIWIFGPNEEKVELEDRLRNAGFGARVVGIETMAEMTKRQFALKVQQRFLRKPVLNSNSTYSLNNH